MIILLILITSCLDDVWILLGESWCWSLSGRKGLNCNRSCWLQLNWSANREEKSLRHVAMVAKFLDDDKSESHLKSEFSLFQLHRSFLISFNLSKVGEIFGLNSKGPYLSLEKEKEDFRVVLTCSKTRQVSKFHVAVVQQRLRNVQKSVMHV